MWRCRYDHCLVTWRQRGWRKYGHYGPASTSSHQQPAPINYPFGCIWKHRDGALCWHSYDDDIMGTLGIMVWLGDSDTLTMCNTSPHQVKFQRSYVTNDGRSAISWCYTSACISVARGECKQIICCFIIRDWICGCWLGADWHQPAAALGSHILTQRKSSSYSAVQTVRIQFVHTDKFHCARRGPY